GGSATVVAGNMVVTAGSLLNSALHFVGVGRGAVGESVMIQRRGVYFPQAGGVPGSASRNLQMTTLDPHGFNPPSLNLKSVGNYADLKEPHVQVWSNVTFADNYFESVPDLTTPPSYSTMQDALRQLQPGGRD